MPPEPGLSLANQTLIYSASTSRAVQRGRSTFGLNVPAFNCFAATYAFEQPVPGARLPMGGGLPIATVNLDLSLGTRNFGTFGRNFSDTNIGEALPTSFALYWKFEMNVGLVSYTVAPTGHYDINNAVNVGRNYRAMALHDVSATNRLQGEWFQIALSCRF